MLHDEGILPSCIILWGDGAPDGGDWFAGALYLCSDGFAALDRDGRKIGVFRTLREASNAVAAVRQRDRVG